MAIAEPGTILILMVQALPITFRLGTTK